MIILAAMGMYNAIFGNDEHYREILDVLGLSVPHFGRFRDAFVTNGEIAVYTRLGGGNRPGYAAVIESLQAHPFYLRDQDDGFDCTYATFYFSIPDEHKERLSKFDIGPFDPDARWKAAIQRAKDDPKEAARVAKELPKSVGIKMVKPDGSV